MVFSELCGRFPYCWAKSDWATHSSTHPREQGQIGGNERHGRYRATSSLASDFYTKPVTPLPLQNNSFEEFHHVSRRSRTLPI